MIGRDMVVEAEIIEQPRRRSLKAHHRHLSRIRQDSESRPSLHINPTLTFSTISAGSEPTRVAGEGRESFTTADILALRSRLVAPAPPADEESHSGTHSNRIAG